MQIREHSLWHEAKVGSEALQWREKCKDFKDASCNGMTKKWKGCYGNKIINLPHPFSDWWGQLDLQHAAQWSASWIVR